MIGSIAAFLVSKGVVGTLPLAEKFAKAGVVVLVIIGLAIATLVIVDSIGDARESEIQAERVEDALEGERRANEADATRRAEREADSAATREQLETIHADDPDAAKAPASAGSRAVADRLRDD